MDKKSIDKVCERLSHLTADSFVLYVKTLNYHWNMKSAQFYMYHKLLEQQYQQLQEAIDDYAERIRSLGRTPPSTMAEFIKIAKLKEGKASKADIKMVEELVADYEHIIKEQGDAIAFADSVRDPASSDLIVGKMRQNDKAAWLLRSHLLLSL